MDPGLVAAVSAGCAAASWATTRFAVPRLPEPPTEELDGDPSPGYAGLAGAGQQAASLALGAAAGTVAGLQPTPFLPLLAVLAGPVAALVLVDLRTTWLPLRLTHACWLLSGLAAVAPVLGGRAPSGLLQPLGGALAALAVFWLVWRLRAGLGFGDVRLAPMLGAGAAQLSWQHWQTWLLAGSLLGAVWGLASQAWRRRHPSPLGQAFPYGPALWLGLWASLLLA
ncbi:A24 family peptidase [Luteococcus peritonei]|uniref:Prepilin peptidase n=1 Tax=Luteococcus peritonei TaxID=88874 RepID=A0ABW4RQQ0_9ACTN